MGNLTVIQPNSNDRFVTTFPSDVSKYLRSISFRVYRSPFTVYLYTLIHGAASPCFPAHRKQPRNGNISLTFDKSAQSDGNMTTILSRQWKNAKRGNKKEEKGGNDDTIGASQNRYNAEDRTSRTVIVCGEKKRKKRKKKGLDTRKSPVVVLPTVHQIAKTKTRCKYNRSIDVKQQSRTKLPRFVGRSTNRKLQISANKNHHLRLAFVKRKTYLMIFACKSVYIYI